jgi:hypothetical protein
MIKKIATLIVLFVIASGCRPSSPPESARSLLRDGVVDMPVDAATAEIWRAAQHWSVQSNHVSVVVSTLSDGSRRVIYFLDIGFESQDYVAVREQFHHQLGEMGWQPSAEPDESGGKVFISGGRKLHLGYDQGTHPTSLILRYESDQQDPKAQVQE